MHPQTESYCGNVNPIGPRACYDEGKRCAETLFFDYRRQHRLRIKVARIFNTYGPRMHPNDGRVVSNFIVQALKGEDITIYGDGMQTRAFCYVDDLIDGCMRLMDHTPDDFTGPVNLGNPVEMPIRHLAETVIRLVGGKSKLVHPAAAAGRSAAALPRHHAGRDKLGWEPKVALDRGSRRRSPISTSCCAVTKTSGGWGVSLDASRRVVAGCRSAAVCSSMQAKSERLLAARAGPAFAVN